MKKYTQEDFEFLKSKRNHLGYIELPAGDWGEVNFKETGFLEFAGDCKFYSSQHFGQCCKFGDGCSFLSCCTFGSGSTFDNGCKFGEFCVFDVQSKFGNGCAFDRGCKFGLLERTPKQRNF